MVALTNGTESNTRVLLERSRRDRHVESMLTTEAGRAYKPHRAVYEHAVTQLDLPADRVTLIAAHAWDAVGARNAGLDTIWVTRLERVWPLPVAEPTRAADLQAAADALLRPR